MGSVRINAVEHARNRRGYNLVALDPAGRVLGAETFDTFFDPAAVRQLAQWVEGPSGTRRQAGWTARPFAPSGRSAFEGTSAAAFAIRTRSWA